MSTSDATTTALRHAWWLVAAALIALVFGVVDLIDFFDNAGAPLRERIPFLVVAGAVIAAWLALRNRNKRLGSTLIALGALPGAAAIILFWHPGFVAFGLLSMAVIATAFVDARGHRRGVAAGVDGKTAQRAPRI